jgi:release factor glutamine methyltransferase
MRGAFAAAGLATPDLDARFLTAGALGLEPADLILRSSRALPAAEQDLLLAWRSRRLAGEPVARILAEWEFWGLPFHLSSDTLVPRPETETVVEAALRACPAVEAPLTIADLGTGSGCLLVALLRERPRARGIGLDKSLGALATARRNVARNGVGSRSLLLASDWSRALGAGFDLLVANPPYIPSPVIATLAPEVREHDPRAALDGGRDGLGAYRAILSDAPRLLVPGGHLVVEIGEDQSEAVPGLIEGLPLAIREIASDLSGRPRCITLRRT